LHCEDSQFREDDIGRTCKGGDKKGVPKFVGRRKKREAVSMDLEETECEGVV
jgi:hypothetical protein